MSRWYTARGVLISASRSPDQFCPSKCYAQQTGMHISWLWKHCLLLTPYLRNEQMLIDIGNMIVGSSHLFHPSVPLQLGYTGLRIATETRPIHNTKDVS